MQNYLDPQFNKGFLHFLIKVEMDNNPYLPLVEIL